MAADQKLARIVAALQDAGIDVLVMGGHAVRHYGIGRNTDDFDLVTSLATPEELRTLLTNASGLGLLREQPVWRRRDFARYEIGRLPDGREEWLEFWLRNHLLRDFASLKADAEIGLYGGEEVPFISLNDLLKSKETERESDWQDIALLEEIRDGRNFSAYESSTGHLPRMLSQLRSRRGIDRVVHRELVSDHDSVRYALASTEHPVSFAFLYPLAAAGYSGVPPVPIDSAMLGSLRSTPFGTAKHFALIEICRRSYKRRAMDLDRAVKQAILAGS